MSELKIMAIGDIHLKFSLLTAALNMATKIGVDYVLLTGDFCDGKSLPLTASVQDFISQATPIIEVLSEFQAFEIGYVLGNHDPIQLMDKLNSLPHLMNLHGKRFSLGGYIIGGIGGFHYVVRQIKKHTLLFPEKPFSYSKVPELYSSIFPCDILVTHAPPMLPSRLNYLEASAGIYQLLERYTPLLNISGHVHEPENHVEELLFRDSQKQVTLLSLGSLSSQKIALITLEKTVNRLTSCQMISVRKGD
jgi:Icc-related predicted phosphoesterase